MTQVTFWSLAKKARCHERHRAFFRARSLTRQPTNTSVMSPGRKTGLPWCGRPAPAREIDERLTRDRRSSVVPLAMEPVDNRVGAGSHQVTQGVSRCPISGILPARSRIQCGYRETYRTTVLNRMRSVREVANPSGAATSRACSRVEVPTTDAERRSSCPKGDRQNASRSRKPVECGESVRRDTQAKPRRLAALLPAVGRWRHQRQG